MIAEDFDILIIGSGGAGLAAAIEASSKGARVRIVEQTLASGGTAFIAGGGCFIVDSPLQRRLGISDSTQLAINDWLSWSQGTADMDWARFYIERSLPDLYLWAEKLGVEWIEVMQQEGNSVPRWHRPKGGGKSVSICLKREAERLDVRWSFSTKLEKIVKEGERVVGAEFSTKSGETQHVDSKSMIVATGGFCSNHDMVRECSNRLKHVKFLVGGGPGAKGSAHRILSEAGGNLD
ncbi:MAG: FAD-dependent oxidoreductase, partial [Nitrososphaerales archaeon]